MWIPGFGSEEIRPYKKACTTEAHKQVRRLQSPGPATADPLSCVSERTHTATITVLVISPKCQRGQEAAGLHGRSARFFLGALLLPYGASVFSLNSNGCHLKLLILGSSNLYGTHPLHISLKKSSFIVADLTSSRTLRLEGSLRKVEICCTCARR